MSHKCFSLLVLLDCEIFSTGNQKLKKQNWKCSQYLDLNPTRTVTALNSFCSSLPPANEVWGKVMISRCLSVHRAQRPPRQRLPCTVKSGRYASYRNAFLFVMCSNSGDKFKYFCGHQILY